MTGLVTVLVAAAGAGSAVVAPDDPISTRRPEATAATSSSRCPSRWRT